MCGTNVGLQALLPWDNRVVYVAQMLRRVPHPMKL